MTPEFNALVADAHKMGLKIGPIAERPDGQWRVYVQKGAEIMQCREALTIEAALGAVLADVQKEGSFKADYEAAVTGKSAPSPSTSLLD